MAPGRLLGGLSGGRSTESEELSVVDPLVVDAVSASSVGRVSQASDGDLRVSGGSAPAGFVGFDLSGIRRGGLRRLSGQRSGCGRRLERRSWLGTDVRLPWMASAVLAWWPLVTVLLPGVADGMDSLFVGLLFFSVFC